MRVYLLHWSGLFLLAGFLMMAGMPSFGVFIYPVPVALYWIQEAKGRSLGLVVGAALLALLLSGDLGLAVVFNTAVALLGVLMGIAIERRFSYGHCVAFVMAGAYGIVLSNMVRMWDALQKEMSIAVSGWVVRLREAAGDASDTTAQPLIDRLLWMDAQYANIAVGLQFGMTLVGVVLGTTLFSRWLRKRGWQAPSGRFATMRPSEWWVCVVILVALLWFAEQRWPDASFRMVIWNSAVALTFLYGLNGLSILVYAGEVLRWPRWIWVLTLAMLMVVGAYPALCAVGLFDTWWELRKKLDRVAMARQLAQRSDDNDSR